MKIGMMADIYMTTVSGVTNSLTISKHWLEKMGHEVYIFTFGDDEVIDNEKNIVRTSGMPVVNTGFYLNLRYNRNARHLLYSMDIAHVHHPFVSGSLAMRYCVPRNIPIVFTNHSRYDLITQAYVPILPESISDAALKAYLMPFYRACDLVIVPSASMIKILEEHFGFTTPVEVIPNGLDLTPFSSVNQPVNRAVLGFNNDHVVCIYVGRLSPEKNLSLLIRAFYGMAMTYDHVRLLIVGDGPERENLENLIKHMKIADKVFFTGMIDYEYIPAYLAVCDIFVNPSSAETFGLSTVEAMAAGLPVLGMDAPGSRDIIEDGITGLITSDDVAVFTAKLIHLSTDHDLRKRMRKQALQKSNKYDIRTTTNSLIQHYERLIEVAQSRKRNPLYKVNRLFDKFQ
jgi:glycosyltransferase involved in cell wall biosynthesis